MIGERYWTTGITVTYSEWNGRYSWSGMLRYYDDGFASDEPEIGIISTEGTLRTRYMVEHPSSEVALSAVIDALVRDAEHLGIEWSYRNIYYRSDGEDPVYPPPENWREILSAQSNRLGWPPSYVSTTKEG